MKSINTMAGIAILIIALPLHAGGIKKWLDEDGTLTFGDVPPPGAIKIETLRDSRTDSASALRPVPSRNRSVASDYYSPQNQLHRMEAARRQQDDQRRQGRKTASREGLLRQQALNRHRHAGKDRQVHRARCTHYRARIDEYEHKTIQAYRREADRLSDRSQLARLRKLATEHCD